jgi:DNA-binding response OmpR family regulator
MPEENIDGLLQCVLTRQADRQRDEVEKKSILVVEDNKTVLNLLAGTLRREGYSVDTATTGNEALQKSNSRFYNLALIDIRLPDIEGTQLLTDMRETTPRLAKIIITGFPTLENAVECANKHADGYLIKPVDMNVLLNRVRICLKRQEEAAEHYEQKVREFIERRARKGAS